MLPALLRRKDVRAWCLYDWANSAFVTSVITVVLPIYFLSLTGDDDLTVGVGGWTYQTSGMALWSYLGAFYMLAAGVASPVLGAIADHGRAKKRFLGLCLFGGAGLTCGLYLVTEGRYQLCGLLFVGAAFLWTCGNLFYDSLLPSLASNERELDAISTAGYAVGYLGGGALLVANLAMVTQPQWFGFADEGVATRVVFLTVGLWWVLFSIPILTRVPEPDMGLTSPGTRNPIAGGFARLLATLRKVRQYRQLVRLLVAFILYNTGIGTVIFVAVVYGRDELELEAGTLMGCILMIQFVGFPASFGFIALARKLGTRGAIFLGLGVYVGVVVFAYFTTTATQFWVLGVLVGLVQGGTQALSRSLYGSMIPPGHSAEFFGFFSIFNKVGSFAGPLVFGVVKDATGSSRLAILFLASFFVLGAAVLATVRVQEGRAMADQA
ncbi:MAG: MFS transporter [bacterium]|nr:MFS transporter [bacterium]